MELLRTKKCSDCGNEDHRVFEFDHIENNKLDNVSQLLLGGYSWEVIEREVNKCEVVCANCHRIRTFTRQNNYRMLS